MGAAGRRPDHADTRSRGSARIGLRSEAGVFLPVATLALIVLSVFSMLSYRGSLRELIDEARGVVLEEAWRVAGVLPPDTDSTATLRRALGVGFDAALLDERGGARASVGDLPAGNLLGALDGAPDSPATAGPSRETADRVVAWLPLRSGLILRVDRPAPTLAAEWRRWRSLMVVVMLAVGSLGTLLVFYLRRLFAPLDTLMRTARQIDAEAPEDDADEIEYLVRRFEAAVKAQEERRTGPAGAVGSGAELRALEDTFSQLESGMALLDLDGRVLSVNSIGLRTLAKERPDPPPTIDDYLADREPLAEILRQALDRSEPVRRREVTLQVGDEERALGLTLSPLRREDGTPRGWVLLFADLTTARREAEHERISAGLDQLAEMTAGLAHELRNSLAAMQGFTTLLARADLPEAAAADTSELQREVDQLHHIVEDFLAFARPGTNDLADVDLLRLAHRTAGDPSLGGAPVRVRADVQDAPWIVSGDDHLLHRLLRNLLLNAVRAQAEEDPALPVEIRLTRTGDGRPELWVEDGGPGLSEEALRTLFVPFATQSEGGSGLGLAVARRIADLHGAELSLHNRTTAGVAARLRFPASPSAADDATKGEPPR